MDRQRSTNRSVRKLRACLLAEESFLSQKGSAAGLDRATATDIRLPSAIFSKADILDVEGGRKKA